MPTIEISGELIIRENLEYYLRTLAGEELNKFIEKAKKDLEMTLREKAATYAMTFATKSSIRHKDGEFLIELHFPDTS